GFRAAGCAGRLRRHPARGRGAPCAAAWPCRARAGVPRAGRIGQRWAGRRDDRAGRRAGRSRCADQQCRAGPEYGASARSAAGRSGNHDRHQLQRPCDDDPARAARHGRARQRTGHQYRLDCRPLPLPGRQCVRRHQGLRGTVHAQSARRSRQIGRA
ncbi:hypothetical protein OY671_011983, partial [Metschnikowia pulcherrima]